MTTSLIQKMVTEIGGIAGFGVVSICLFVTVFSAALLLVLRMKKPFAKTMSALPLEDGTTNPIQAGENHHG